MTNEIMCVTLTGHSRLHIIIIIIIIIFI